MKYSFKNIQIHICDFGVLLINIIYFIPKSVNWLMWDSGITIGYVGVELIFNYLIHGFFIYSCISIIKDYYKSYERHFLFIVFIIYLVSFVFAFRIIEFVVFVPVLLYLTFFYRLFIKIKFNESFERKYGILGFVISVIWLLIDQKFFG